MTWLLVALALLGLVVLLVRRSAGGADGPSSPFPAAPAPRYDVAPGRPPSEPLRRALDPDDPDGAFMDGYVSGRYTERWLAARSGQDVVPQDPPEDAHRNWAGDDGEDDTDLWLHHDDHHHHGHNGGRDDVHGGVHDDSDLDDW